MVYGLGESCCLLLLLLMMCCGVVTDLASERLSLLVYLYGYFSSGLLCFLCYFSKSLSSGVSQNGDV